MQKGICDCCGQEAKYFTQIGKMEYVNLFQGKIERLGIHYDLCEDCYRKVNQLIKGLQNVR